MVAGEWELLFLQDPPDVVPLSISPEDGSQDAFPNVVFL